MLATNFTMVKISVAAILSYFLEGIEVRIPSREDMVQMHKDMELYLGEWREYLRVSINVQVDEHKDLIIGLEKLSKYIYEKCKSKEVIDSLFLPKKFGLTNPLQEIEQRTKPVEKPSYEGIASLVRSKTSKPVGRF